MNKFQTLFYGETAKLELRDIITWVVNGKRTPEYMLCQMNHKIILMDTKSAVSADLTFDSLNHAEDYLRRIKVDDDKIQVVNGGEWVVYVP